MKVLSKSLAAMVAAATLVGGGAFAVAGTAYAADNDAITVTPNPWYANSFDGWGTSLAWFANATGSLGEESAITTNLGDDASKAKAVEYGKQLREQFYQSIFGDEGLDLNMARYNVGGGNASDVAYGYPFMRQGAAVPGTWKDDATGSGTYGNGVTTRQADKDKLAAAFDPTDDNQYDFSKSAAQDWWIERGATGDNPDITDVEAFANSAPWFLTNSGYATGGRNSGSNNLANPEKFAQYMAKNVEHLESLGANVDTVEPFNESETSYWGTPGDMASKYTDESDDNTKLINNYWDKYYSDKDRSVTPYSNALKKPQEGMHVSNAQQQQTITALAEALKDNDDTIIAATDATNSADFVKSYNQYPQAIKDLIGQYNVHAYSDSNQMQSRDIAQADGKKLSMSEVDGSWQSGSYNPYGFDNALGMMSKISSNVTRLQSKDFTFWQVVEDLYNMQMGSNVNPAGENTNWGTVLIDFDCTVAGMDGKLYSERRVNNNGGTTDGLEPCTVIANAKYNGVKAITHFIHAGDKVIANNDEDNNMTATSDDGKTQTVIHRNSGTSDQTFVIDLSKYGEIADNAYGELYLTTETSAEDKNAGVDSATPEVFAKTSNVKQAEGSVMIDKAAKTATVTVPARSIASIQLTGVTGYAKDAAVETGDTYQLVGKQSGKAVADTTSGDSALSLANVASDAENAKKQTWTFTQIEQPADSERPDLKAYVITNAEGKVLVSKDGTNALSNETVEAAKSDPAAKWILNTSDGSTYQLLNAATKTNLDVDNSGTAVGTKVGLWQSPSGTSPSANQTWTLRNVTPTGQKTVNVQTAVNAKATLPTEVTLYYTWGEGKATVANWDTSKVDVAKEGTYEATATATDVYGNEFNVAATVYVGALTVSDPVSATVLAGTSASEAKAALEAEPVYLHVKASPAFEGDAAKVTWNFDGLDAKLAEAKAGDNIAVAGTYQLDDTTTIALKGTIYVTAATPENVADTASNLTVTNQQTEYSKGDQWKKLTDDDTSAEAWVTWNAKNDYSASPTATVNFGEEREVTGLTITYGDKAPASAKAEYTTDGTTWTQFGSEVKPKAGQTVTFTPEDGSLKATQVRIVNTQNGDFMNATEIEAFVVPVVGGVKNIAAASGTNFSVNFQEGASASKAIDGDTTSKGWSTWASTASTVDPVATFTFDEAQTITEVKTFFYYDGRASWPKSQTLEYQDEAGEWHEVGTKDGWKTQAGDAGSGSDGITAADTPTVDFVLDTPVKAKAIRLTNTLQDTKVYINVAEIQVFAQDNKVITPQPASDATLGDLRLDGETIKGFAADKTDYTVDLPFGAEANPVLQAFAADNAAAVKVTGDAVENGKLGGKATITVTSADESETKTYTVTFKAFTLASLKVIGPTKTEYAIGDKLDTAGLKVTAVYQSGDKTKEVPVALDDPQLAIGSFDSTTAGKKAITVSYRGVTATFNVTVKANAVAPGPEEQKPGSTNKPGATGNGNKNTVANTGSNVAAIAGAVALLAAAAGALFMLRKRA